MMPSCSSHNIGLSLVEKLPSEILLLRTGRTDRELERRTQLAGKFVC